MRPGWESNRGGSPTPSLFLFINVARFTLITLVSILLTLSVRNSHPAQNLNKTSPLQSRLVLFEAWVGIEPTVRVLQTHALPLGDQAGY